MAKRDGSYQPVAPEAHFRYSSQLIDEEEEVAVENALPPVELRDPQQIRLERQQQFKDAFHKLEMLHQELSQFSAVHHYFKQATKDAWLSRLEMAMEDLRFFLPKDYTPLV